MRNLELGDFLPCTLHWGVLFEQSQHYHYYRFLYHKLLSPEENMSVMKALTYLNLASGLLIIAGLACMWSELDSGLYSEGCGMTSSFLPVL